MMEVAPLALDLLVFLGALVNSFPPPFAPLLPA
jgi:hypothetical protein